MTAHIIEGGVTLCGQALPIVVEAGPTELCPECCRVFVAARRATVQAVARPAPPLCSTCGALAGELCRLALPEGAAASCPRALPEGAA